MSVFTTVSPEDLRHWLQDYAVGELQDLRGIAAGIENTNYFVTTSTGRYVLTLFEKLTARELPFYLNLMAHLAERGVPSAHPVANRSGHYLGTLKGKPAALVARLDGSDVSKPTAAQCGAVGAVLARLHLAGGSSLALEVEQGGEMGRPSLLILAARREADGTIRVRVGGGVVPVSRGVISL